jgi:hypothetical protein
MVVDPGLLKKAKDYGAVLAEADRQALAARADYHTAVRRLHLAGAALREIAEALGISHQRVQQIVAGAGGSWWRRAWGTRRARPDAVCTWCGRPPAEVAKLIAGPRVYICDACVAAAERAMAGVPSDPFTPARKRNLVVRCAFCGRRGSEDRSVVSAPGGHVCSSCLRICRDILG